MVLEEVEATEVLVEATDIVLVEATEVLVEAMEVLVEAMDITVLGIPSLVFSDITALALAFMGMAIIIAREIVVFITDIAVERAEQQR